MSLLNQIPKLSKIPQILNKKREADKESKKRNQEEEEKKEFPLKNKDAFKKPPVPAKIKKKESGDYETKPKAVREGVGNNIDLKI